ncbi:C-type lectin LmsL-like [Crotalus adamanteus]|uniref:C-type lectin LmsL-like n=1 Tax=Crotalus adamanteus TaxID=8729 RepID=A0AAW1B7J7_CROAD
MHLDVMPGLSGDYLMVAQKVRVHQSNRPPTQPPQLKNFTSQGKELKKQGNCYGYFDAELSWDAAELECQSYGPGCHLASILSRHESSMLSVYIRDKQGSLSSVWMGLYDISGKRWWRWVDESTYNYRAWMVHQPDNYNQSEHCGELTYDSSKPTLLT